ncbi:MAG TPA: ubiquitin-like domain-containing protein [Candidatus Pristimantibacillus sp.]|nr:ubiquitin-like domain-containing protein [Candidatus Pristimantibacillus sp.]
MRKRFLRLKKRYSAQQRQHVKVIKRASRRPFVAIPVVTVLVLIFLSVVGVLVLSGGKPKLVDTETHVVIISHDNVEQSVPTRERTVGDVLKRANVAVHEGDVVEPDQTTEVVSDNFRVNVYRAVPVTVIDQGKKVFAYSAAKTPRSIVKQAGIEVYPEDRLNMLPVSNFLVEGSIGERVVIQRATAVNLNLYGTQLELRTQARTVGELLKEKNIMLSSGDTVQPAVDRPISANDQVFVLRKGIKIEFAEETIAMPQQIIEDPNLSFGTQVLRQQGTTGKRLVTYQVDQTTGERKAIQSVTVVEAVTNIIARGKAVQIPSDKQAVMAAAGIRVSDYPYVDFIASHEGGWCPTKIQGTHNCPGYMNPSDVPSYGGYGIFQATPGSKMASAGSDWATSAVTQIRWATGYAVGRYGSWSAAYEHWQSHHNW